MLLARSLKQACPDVEVLLLTGSSRADSFADAAGLKIVKLPTVTKDPDGKYVSGVGPRVPLAETVRVRKNVLREALREFAPHVLLVDHTPTGLCGELLPLLVDLRRQQATRLVLGLRDIIDEPGRVVDSWKRQGIYALLESVYHEIWVYGNRSVFALDELYEMPTSIASRVAYLGYLFDRRAPSTGPAPSLSRDFAAPDRPHLLCLVGGGGDGYSLASQFARTLAARPDAWNATLVTGPFARREDRLSLERICSPLRHVQILRFTPDVGRLMDGSDLVLTMGGYNSMLEAIGRGKRTIAVPRVFPRREQWLRAVAFQSQGVLRMLEPEQLTPSLLADEIEALLAAPPPDPVDLGRLASGGLSEFTRRIQDLLQHVHPPEQEPHRAFIDSQSA